MEFGTSHIKYVNQFVVLGDEIIKNKCIESLVSCVEEKGVDNCTGLHVNCNEHRTSRLVILHSFFEALSSSEDLGDQNSILQIEVCLVEDGSSVFSLNICCTIVLVIVLVVRNSTEDHCVLSRSEAQRIDFDIVTTKTEC